MEQVYEDSQGERGLDDYQGHLWDGLPRYVALVMLACTARQAEAVWEPSPPFTTAPKRPAGNGSMW
jgi:hypothetical protein